MRRLLSPLLLTFAVSLSAQTADIRFIPPAPDSHTPVTARIAGVWQDSAFPRCAQTTVTEQDILIVAGCLPDVALPAVASWSLDVALGTLSPGVYDVELRIPNQGPLLIPYIVVESQLIVRDAEAPFSVLPDIRSGLSQRIVLKGSALRCDDAAACVQPIVRFGSEQVVVVRASGDEIEVEAPPGGTGTVDVTVQRGPQTLRRAAAFHFPDVSGTPAVEFFTPILFPVFFSANGAFGSVWETEVSVANANPYEFSTPFASIFDQGCDLCDPPPGPRIQPGQARVVRASAFSNLLADGGYLLHVPRSAADGLHFGILVRDLSRQAEALGTEIPVVREDDFYESAFSLLNVPADQRFRVALRVYSLDGAARLQLRIRSMASEEVLANASLATLVSEQPRLPHGALVIGDLLTTFPQLAGAGPLRLEIVPESPGHSRVWAFVAVTNNQTQHVTTISPQ